MNRIKAQLPCAITCAALLLCIVVTEEVKAMAGEKNGYNFPNAGIAEVLNPGNLSIEEKELPKEEELDIYEKIEAERNRMIDEIVMAKVNNTLNVRAEASEEASRVGYLYKDCGGTILEQKDGWTKIKSGALTGWCSDDYLYFSDEAREVAEEAGHWTVTTNAEAMRIRKEPDENADIMTIVSKTDIIDFVEVVDKNWVSVGLEGELGYVSTDCIDVAFNIDEGETVEQVKTRYLIEKKLREEAEAAAREEERKRNRGAVDANTDELRLLAALIYCESGNQSYESMVGVGAVVMNRVKSPAYPNTIYSVIYASGQFTPARSGRLDRIYVQGPPQICYQAAQAALNGETTVGGSIGFRYNDGRPGYVIGVQVFFGG